MVAPERYRQCGREMHPESFEARARRSPEAVDALVVVTDHKRFAAFRDQLDETLLRKVQVLVLIDQYVRVARAVCVEYCRLLLEHSHGQRQQVFEVEEPVLGTSALISPEESHA